MVLSQESTFIVNPVSDVIKGAVMSSFSILSALSIRDVLIKTLEATVPNKTNERLIFVYFYASVVILLTLLFAWLWQTSST
jgi:hypothetical protein